MLPFILAGNAGLSILLCSPPHTPHTSLSSQLKPASSPLWASCCSWLVLLQSRGGRSTNGQLWLAVRVRVAVNDITARFSRSKCREATAQVHEDRHARSYMRTSCTSDSLTYTQVFRRKTLCVNRTARCKQAERRMEYTGEGSTGEASKKTRVGKGGGLWEEGEEERKRRRGSSILTTCTINNRGSAVVSWEQWGWKGFGVSTCSRRSLPNPNLNRPPTHNKAPLSSPFMHVLCPAPEHIFSHSLIARSLASRPLAAEHRAPACETQGTPWAQ